MAVEDLTTYTETDAPGRLAVTSAAATVTDLDRDENVNLYSDKGASHFDALDIDFEVFVGSGTTGFGVIAGIALTANVETGIAGLATTDVFVVINNVDATPDIPRLRLSRGNQVAIDDSIDLAYNTIYYCTITRAAGNNTVTVTIYSDSARTTTVDTLSVAGYSTATYQYLYALLAVNDGGTGRALDGYIQNIDLNEGLTVTLPLGTLNLTGIIPTLKLQMTMPLATMNLTGLAPTLQHKLNMVLGTLNLTGFALTLDIIKRIRLHAPKRDTALLAPERDLSLTAPKRDFNLIAKRTHD